MSNRETSALKRRDLRLRSAALVSDFTAAIAATTVIFWKAAPGFNLPANRHRTI
ncbi:MAG: hypothetical protein ABSA78_07535 [Candidatus Sulfotelmatobacter sp.]